VERVFGVLFEQFDVLYQPSRLHHMDSMQKVVRSCVILHNMIFEARSCDYYGLIGDEATFGLTNATNVRSIPKGAQLKSVWSNGERRL
jgi:hypothetical protein